MMYCPAPCILSLAGPIKGGAGNRVLRTLGLSCYTVILALPGCLHSSEGSLREGDGDSANEGRMGILQHIYKISIYLYIFRDG